MKAGGRSRDTIKSQTGTQRRRRTDNHTYATMMTHQADQHPHVSQNLKCPSIEIKSTEAMSPSDVCLVTNRQPTTTHTTQSPATGRTCCNTALCKHCCKPTQFFLHNVISGMPEHLSTRSHNHFSRREYKKRGKKI